MRTGRKSCVVNPRKELPARGLELVGRVGGERARPRGGKEFERKDFKKEALDK